MQFQIFIKGKKVQEELLNMVRESDITAFKIHLKNDLIIWSNDPQTQKFTEYLACYRQSAKH